jgi:hypothetical protein
MESAMLVHAQRVLFAVGALACGQAAAGQDDWFVTSTGVRVPTPAVGALDCG